MGQRNENKRNVELLISEFYEVTYEHIIVSSMFFLSTNLFLKIAISYKTVLYDKYFLKFI